uniref:Uncharacterized protein n=1 Tax=Avena sativa TaxID=4498 RepID=A0ACD5ZXZ4_AVESA
MQYLPNHPTGLVCLRGPSCNTWLVEIASDTKGLFFGDGWKKFVTDHSIESGNILTFCYDGRSQFSVVVFDGMCIQKPSAFHAKPSKNLIDTTDSDEEDNGMSIVPQEENNGTKKSMTSEIDANGSLRKHSNGASIGYKSDNLNSIEGSDSSYCMSEESISCNDSSKSVPRLLEFSKDVNVCGETIAECQRQPEVTSQRPPVSGKQKNYALQKAKKYKSKYPITVQIMKDTFVYKIFFMIIPCKFVKEHLPQTKKKLTLWDPQGRAWEVTYVYCNNRCVGAFSGGWGKFSIGNHLEMFDVCVFELFSKDNIKVHIYRANPTLYPYLLDSKPL